LHGQIVEERALRHGEVRALVVRRHAALVAPPELDAAPIRLQPRRGFMCELRRLAAGQRDVPAAARSLGEQLADVARGGFGVVENDRLYAHRRILRERGYVVGSTLVVPNA
jgi:hypothetical protein